MKPECVDAVTRAAGRALTKAEIDGIESRIRTALRDMSVNEPERFTAMTLTDRVFEAAKLAKDRMLEDTAAAHETAIREVAIRAKLDAFRGSIKPGDRLKGAMQKLFYDAGSRAGDTSVEMDRKAIQGEFMAQLGGVHGYDKGKFFGHIQDTARQEKIIRELFGESTGDAEARKVGDQIRKTLSIAHDRAVRAGVGFHELDAWHLPQPADWTKVGVDRDTYINDHMGWIDRRAYVNADGTRMNDAQTREFLGHVWETQATNGAYKRADAEGVGSALGGSRSMPRQVHYKDADAYMAAMTKYGRSTNAYSLLMQHFSGLSKDVALAEKLGRNAEANFRYLIEKSFGDDVKSTPDKKGKLALAAMKRKAERQWEVLANGEGVGNQVWANRMAAVRSVISSTMLGGLFGAFPDVAMIKLTAQMNGLPQLKAMGQSMKGIFSKSDGEMMSRLGLAPEGMQSAAHRFGIEELGTGIPRFLNEAVHRLSGLHAFDRGMKSGIGLTMMDLFGKLSRDRDLSKLQGGDHDFLVNSKGVEQRHWDVWNAAEVDRGPDGSRTILSPESIYKIPDAKMRDLGYTTPDDAARAKSDAVTKLLSATLSEMQGGARGAMGSSIGDKAALGLDKMQAGTIGGEIARLVFLLKQTPLGIAKAHLFDRPRALDGWKSQWAYRAQFVAYSAVIGALSIELKNLANGANPEKMNDPRFIQNAIIAGGGFGIYGDLLFADTTHHNNGALSLLAGPGATAIDDTVKMFGSAKKDFEESGRYNYGSHALDLARKNLSPLMNLWYTKAAFNHLIYQNLQDRLNPGYSSRLRDRMQSTYGKSYWWTPGAHAPEKAPDLSTAVR